MDTGNSLVSPLSPEEAEAEAENVKLKIEELKMLLAEETTLNCLQDDDFLLKFLRAREFNVSRAFRNIQRYYRLKVDFPEVFTVNRPSELLQGLRDNFVTILPGRDDFGRIVVIIRPGMWEPSHCEIKEAARIVTFLIEKGTEAEESQTNGVVLIEDWSNFGWCLFKHARPWTSVKWITPILEAYPFKLKAIHVVHHHRLFNILYALSKPFVKEKILRLIRFYGANLRSLHEYVNPNILPAEFGGLQPPIDNSLLIEQLLARDDKYEAMSKYGYTTGKAKETWF